jgi:hypothetical protein
MACYGSLSPVSGNESLPHWNESLCVEMSRYEITRVVGHPPKTLFIRKNQSALRVLDSTLSLEE